MIKTLKVSDKTVRKFKSHKSWDYSTRNSLTNIVLEQTKQSGSPVPLVIDEAQGLATEQTTSRTSVKIKRGKNISGTFYPIGHKNYDPLVEKVNYDGSYYRSVYNSIKHLFYNDYGIYQNSDEIKNPLMVFGSETGQYKTDSHETDAFGNRAVNYERRIIKDDILVIEFSKNQFGEKIKPGDFRIVDYSSPFGTIEIVDDGATNLVISEKSFNEIKEVKRSTSNILNKVTGNNNFNSSDMLVGKTLASDGDYVLSGSPMHQDSPSDYLTGSASLFKYDPGTKEYRSVREFKCPFTQQGLLIESELDSTGFLVTELNQLLGGKNYSINDEFGEAVELKNGTCAIGSPKSHIHGDCNQSRSGHVFLYDVDKGGSEHWGLTNVLEGDPGSEFGKSISIHGKYMAIGAPSMYNCEGAIYIFEKKIRTKTTPWYRISNAHSKFCYNEVTKTFTGFPVCDKLEELNSSAYRWKISTASPDEYELTFFGSEPDECEENEIIMFDSDDSISSFGFETGFPVSKYHEFENGDKTPKTGIGDVTWELISIVRTPGSDMLGQKVKLFGDILISSTPETDKNDVYVFNKRPSKTGSCDVWVHTQTINKNKIDNLDNNNLEMSEYFDAIKYEVVGDKIVVEVDTKTVAEPTDEGFIYRFNKRFGFGQDRYKSKILHGGSVITTNKFELQDIPTGDHELYIGRYKGSMLVGNPSVITFSVNPKIYEVEPRENTVKYPYQYFDHDKSNFGISIETNGKYIFIGDDNDRKYVDTDVELLQGISYSAGSVWMYEITDTTIEFNKKIYENVEFERRYNNRFGCGMSLIGNDLLIGSPCSDESRILINNEGTEFMIPDFAMGVENNDEEHYSVGQSLYTSFTHKYVGTEFVDMIISIDVKTILNIDLSSTSDFMIRGSFIHSDTNKVDTELGAITNGVFRDKTFHRDGKIHFHVKTISHLFDPLEELEFIYTIKKNSIQGVVNYFRIDDGGKLNSIKEIKSVKQKNSVKTQYGIDVSLSSTRIYVGNSITGDWPVDQITSFGDDELVSFDSCSHIFSQRGDIIWGNLQNNELLIEGSIIAYDIKTIRDGDRVYVGNIFYKNGIAVITELADYFENILSLGGRRGFEIYFNGVNSIYENEILCKVNPNEFNVSTNPSSVEYEEIDFDINGDNKFDIIDLSYIYRYILGSFKRASSTDEVEGEVNNSLVLEQDTQWPNEDIILSESDDVILMNVLLNLTANVSLEKEEELRMLDKLDNLSLLKENGLDIDSDGVVSATDAKLLARYFVGRTGISLTQGLINPLVKNVKRQNAYQIIKYLDEKTGKYRGRKIRDGFLEYEDLNKKDKTGSFLAPYATTVGLYDGPDLVMTAKLANPIKLVPNYPINFLIKYDV